MAFTPTLADIPEEYSSPKRRQLYRGQFKPDISDIPNMDEPQNVQQMSGQNLPQDEQSQQPVDQRNAQIERFKNITGTNKGPGFAENFTGGALNGLLGIVKMLPDLAKNGSVGPNAMFHEAGESPANKLDAYKMMGTEEKPFNTLSGLQQTAGELFMPGKAIGKSLKYGYEGGKNISNVFNKINPKEVAKSIQKQHDTLKNHSVSLFDLVEDEATKRGVNKIPIAENLVDDISDYLPHTRSVKKLLEKSKTGDYSSLRKLQSDLGYKGTKNKSSPLSSDRDAGDEMLDLRERINDSVSNHFKNTGNHDLDKTLNEAREKYEKLKETYYSNPTINKLVHEETRKVPKNIINVLSEDSVPMERLRKENPFAAQHVEAAEKKENALKTLKKLGIGGGVGGSAYATYKILNHLLGGE